MFQKKILSWWSKWQPINVWSPLPLPKILGVSSLERKFARVWVSPQKQFPPLHVPLFSSLKKKSRILCPKKSSFLVFSSISAVEDNSLINGPSPNFQHVSLWIFSHEKASIHSHNSLVSTTKVKLQEFTYCMKLPSKELSICNHIFHHSSMEIYKFKAIISIKLL